LLVDGWWVVPGWLVGCAWAQAVVVKMEAAFDRSIQLRPPHSNQHGPPHAVSTCGCMGIGESRDKLAVQYE